MGERYVARPPGVWYKRLVSFLWYDIILLAYIAIVATLKEMSTSAPVPDIKKMERRTGQVAVLTGGPRGLAIGIIKRLVQLDYTIIIGVRNIKDGETRLAQFAQANMDLSIHKIQFLEMDLMSLESMRHFAANVLRKTPRIDLLLCNAAIMRAPYGITEDGFESQFQVNYLSNFLLTHLLLERMKETAAARRKPCQIIYSSSMFHICGDFLEDELETPYVYTPYKFYFPSKLYPIMSMMYLQRQLDQENSQVFCYAMHPGLIPTELWISAGGPLVYWFGSIARKLFRSIENGADTILWPILSPKFQNLGGLYMESGSSIPISELASDKKKQAFLYKKSLKFAGLAL